MDWRAFDVDDHHSENLGDQMAVTVGAATGGAKKKPEKTHV
jgi:hypothetical protein